MWRPPCCATARSSRRSKKSASAASSTSPAFRRGRSHAALAMAGATPADVDVWAIARGRRVHLLQKAWFALTHRPGARAARSVPAAPPARARSIPDVIAQTFGLRLSDVEARATTSNIIPRTWPARFYTSGMQEPRVARSTASAISSACRWRTGAAAAWTSSIASTSRIRSACSTSPSRSIWASRNTATSTR